MSSGGFGQFLVAALAIATQNWWLLAANVLGSVTSDRQASRARRRAEQQQNEAAKDRLVMVDLLPNAPRTLVMGRVRYVEGVRDVWTSGTNDEKLTMVVSFAGHEIDGFEQWYLDDKPVTLDGSGWVNEAPYRSFKPEPLTVSGTLDGAGAATLVLTAEPPPGSPRSAVWTTGTGENVEQGECTLVITGTSAACTGGRPGAPVVVTYFLNVETKSVRIRPYLGTTGQNVGADLASEYPGKVTSNDRFAGIALAVVDVMFEPDIFPQGRPNVSAVLRGAKLYDPRTGTTVFSQNLALMALHYFTYTYGWARSSTLARTADIVAAANACDTSTAFVLRKPDGSTSTVTRALYHGGITIPDDADKAQAMASLVDAMGGREGWAGGQWRLRAGVLGSTVATITQDWLVNVNSGGQPDDEPVITAVQSIPRTARTNFVSGSCTDPDQRYQLLPFPAVEDPVLVAAKGKRQAEVEWQAVNHIAHAQHLASMMIRRAQAGLQLELTCGEQAADLELLDVVELDMPDYGYSAKPFEVVGITWNPTGAYKLTLLETAAALYTVDAELAGRDPAPDGNLREPWDVETMAAPTVTSGTTPTLDGSIITRTVLTFTPAVGQNIRRGGQIEVQYTEATATLPTGDWPSWVEQGDAAKATIPGLLQGRFFFFRIRAVQTLPLVRGKWSPVVLHQVATVRAAVIFRQAAAPTGDVKDGDEWFDTDDGNKHYVREAGSWVSVRDSGIAQALADAADAQATADGKIATFYEASPPTAEGVGDIWFDTDDGNKQYRWSGSAWVLAVDTRIGQAISDAADAQATADGKVTTFVATTAPTADAVGDLWLDTDDGNKLYRWSGAAWLALPVGTGGIAPGAATEVVMDEYDFAGATTGTGSGVVQRTVVVTPAVDSVVEVTGYISATNVVGDSGNRLGWSVTPAGGSLLNLSEAPVSTTAKQVIPTTNSFVATGGVALTFELRSDRPGGNPAMAMGKSYMRITLVKR